MQSLPSQQAKVGWASANPYEAERYAYEAKPTPTYQQEASGSKPETQGGDD